MAQRAVANTPLKSTFGLDGRLGVSTWYAILDEAKRATVLAVIRTRRQKPWARPHGLDFRCPTKVQK
jgi:hypothetical protein